MAIAQVVAQFMADTSQLRTQLAAAQASVASAASSFQRAGSTMGGAFKETEKSSGNLKQSMHHLQEQSQAVGSAFGVAGVAIGAALGFSVKKAADFEQAIDKVAAVSGATDAELVQLRQTALELGASTSKSASEVAEGMQQMAAAGYNANEIIAAMPGIIAAAEASGESMARTTEVVSAALNGFGLEASDASHVADVLAQSANQSAASIDDMGYAFKYAAPVAKQLGFSLEWLAAATGVMADAGMRGEQAGTTLRMAFTRLVDPPREAAKTIEQMGISLHDANGKMKPAPQLLNEIFDGLRKMSGEQRAAAASIIFGTEAMSGMLTLMDTSPEKFNKLVQGLENSDGAAAKTAEIMKGNLKGSLEELSGAIETLQISFGSKLAPVIDRIANGLTKLVNWFNSLSGPMQTFIVIFSSVVAILLILGSIVAFVAAGIAAIAVAFGVAASTVTIVIGIIAAVVAVLFAVGAAAVWLWNNWDRIMNAIKTVAINVWNTIKQWLSTTWESIKQSASSIWNSLKATITNTWNSIKSFATNVWNNIKSTVVGAFEWMYNHNYYFEALVNFIRDCWNKAKEWTSSVWNTVKSFLSSVWNGLKSTGNSIFNGIKSVISSVWNTIKSLTTNTWNSIKSATSSAWNSVKSTISNVANSIKSTLSGLASQALSWGKNLLTMFADGIKSKVSAVVSAAKDAAKAVARILGFHSPTEEGPASDSDTWAPNFVKMFADGLRKTQPLVERQLNAIAGKMQSLSYVPVNPQLVNPVMPGSLIATTSSNSFGSETQDGNIIITGNTFNVRSENDIRQIAKELDRLKNQRLRSLGKVR